jgi:HSP20 family protein
MNVPVLRRDVNTMFNRLVDDFWNECCTGALFPSLTSGIRQTNKKFSYPKWDLSEKPDDFIVEAAVPGLTKEDVKVEYADGLLTIKGQKQESSEKEYNGYLTKELHKSNFSRSLTVDEDRCDVERIEADVRNGMLRIKIPKKGVDKPENKRIIEVT